MTRRASQGGAVAHHQSFLLERGNQAKDTSKIK